jgi:uncharacterized SAM-binding protein YcdF (DUF218 family)
MEMFLIKKIITAWILPLGLFIILTAFCGAFLIKGGKRTGWVLVIMSLLLYALSIAPSRDALLMPLETYHPFTADVTGDVIVALGGGLREDVPDINGRGFPAEQALVRMVAAFRLWRRLNVPIIVSGGGTLEERQGESAVTKRILVDLGVPDEQILTDCVSRDTYENSYYTKRILDEDGFHSPILVTSAYHMRRAVVAFKKQGAEVIPFPCNFRGQSVEYDFLAFMPSAESLADVSVALKEYLGLVAYQLGIF